MKLSSFCAYVGIVTITIAYFYFSSERYKAYCQAVSIMQPAPTFTNGIPD